MPSPNRRDFIKATGAAALAASRSATAAEPTGPRKPNFVVIFIDDMGYGDIEPFGSTLNRTPHLNRMAKEGMKLTSFYVAAPVCTPSRAALLTGCYPRRVGLGRGSWHAVLMPGDRHGLNPDEVTIAEVLKRQGYATGCFGKWHLGDQPKFLPTRQGFDTYFGIPYSNDMWAAHPHWQFPPLPLVRDEKVVGEVKDMADQALLCKQFTDAAVTFIRAHRDEPFLCYLPHAFVHHPRAARERFLERAGLKGQMDWSRVLKAPWSVDLRVRTQAQIEEVDWSVGQILDTLRELGIEKDTLVLFTSDNGGARGCVNKPLRGGKGSTWEGGMREPTLAWWPGTVPAGATCNEVATAMDLLPTFARLAGTAPPQDRILDGRDIAPLLLGKAEARSPHEAFYYYDPGRRLRAVRSGPWKLWHNGRLTNLEEDIGERRNVAKQNPEVVARLEKLLAQAREDLGDGGNAGKNCRPVGVAKNPRTLLPRPGVEGEAAYAPAGPHDRKRKK